MSEAFAAVTLLAIANGAGDVITALVASGTSGGISYNIGSLYGAGLFCTSIIIATTIQGSTVEIKVDKNLLFRDIGIYILATVMTMVFAIMYNLSIL
jgi:sodium/potassium/calcium exchanger 6